MPRPVDHPLCLEAVSRSVSLLFRNPRSVTSQSVTMLAVLVLLAPCLIEPSQQQFQSAKHELF